MAAELIEIAARGSFSAEGCFRALCFEDDPSPGYAAAAVVPLLSLSPRGLRGTRRGRRPPRPRRGARLGEDATPNFEDRQAARGSVVCWTLRSGDVMPRPFETGSVFRSPSTPRVRRRMGQSACISSGTAPTYRRILQVGRQRPPPPSDRGWQRKTSATSMISPRAGTRLWQDRP